MLYICRGIPGSGKSTYAKKLGCFHIEADMYFECQGKYIFDPRRLSAAHVWCNETVKKALKTGMDVVVSNTFTQLWEIKPYIKYANKYKFPFKIIEMHGEFQDVHGVPPEKKELMKNRWQDLSDIYEIEHIFPESGLATLPVPDISE